MLSIPSHAVSESLTVGCALRRDRQALRPDLHAVILGWNFELWSNRPLRAGQQEVLGDLGPHEGPHEEEKGNDEHGEEEAHTGHNRPRELLLQQDEPHKQQSQEWTQC